MDFIGARRGRSGSSGGHYSRGHDRKDERVDAVGDRAFPRFVCAPYIRINDIMVSGTQITC